MLAALPLRAARSRSNALERTRENAVWGSKGGQNRRQAGIRHPPAPAPTPCGFHPRG